MAPKGVKSVKAAKGNKATVKPASPVGKSPRTSSQKLPGTTLGAKSSAKQQQLPPTPKAPAKLSRAASPRTDSQPVGAPVPAPVVSQSVPAVSTSSAPAIGGHEAATAKETVPVRYARRSDMISALQKRLETPEKMIPKAGASQNSESVRLRQEGTIAWMNETIKKLKSARARADEKSRTLEQKLAAKEHELQQQQQQQQQQGRQGDEEHSIACFAELLANEVAAQGPSAKVKKAQKKLLSCLAAPEKFPATQTAAKLVKALEGMTSWGGL